MKNNIKILKFYFETETSNKMFELEGTDKKVFLIDLQNLSKSEFWEEDIKKNMHLQHCLYIFFDSFEENIYSIYIGETSNIIKRWNDHNKKNDGSFKYVLIINSNIYANTDKINFHESLLIKETKELNLSFEIKK